MAGVAKHEAPPAAALSSSLIVTKGQAAPVMPFAPFDGAPEPVTAPVTHPVTPSAEHGDHGAGKRRSRPRAQTAKTGQTTKTDKPNKKNGAAPGKKRVSLTLRLDPDRFFRLKVFAAHSGQSHQDILHEALESYLGEHAHATAPHCACLEAGAKPGAGWGRILQIFTGPNGNASNGKALNGKTLNDKTGT